MMTMQSHGHWLGTCLLLFLPFMLFGNATTIPQHMEGCDLMLSAETNDVSCPGESDGSISITANDGVEPYTFQWNTGATASAITGLPEGQYEVIVTDATGCTDNLTIFITAPDPLEIFAEPKPPRCYGEDNGRILIDSVLGGVFPFEVSLDGDFYQSLSNFPFEFRNLSPGLYTVYLRDFNNCEVETDFLVSEPSQLTLDLGPDQLLSFGEGYTLNPEVNFAVDTFFWRPRAFLPDPGSLVNFVRPNETIEYFLTATDPFGCSITDSIQVGIDPDRGVYIPNVFTPNGDGLNDYLTVYGGPALERVISFQVFNRWGNLVYRADDFSPNNEIIGWDGTYRGEKMNGGVYIYFAEIAFFDGVPRVFKGDFILVR